MRQTSPTRSQQGVLPFAPRVSAQVRPWAVVTVGKCLRTDILKKTDILDDARSTCQKRK